MLKLAQGADEVYDISHAYFIMTPVMEEMVRGLLKNGVKIRLLTNSGESVDEPVIARPMRWSRPGAQWSPAIARYALTSPVSTVTAGGTGNTSPGSRSS